MEYLVVLGTLALLIAIVCAIVKAASGDRYANMTEEEFEAEAKRSSRISAAVSGVQKIIDPGHRVEHVQEQKERLEADGAQSGDRPDAGHGSGTKS
jgi:hypothetical protein